jgi:hypothetical protein
MEKLNALIQSYQLPIDHNQKLYNIAMTNVYEEKISFHKSKQKFCRWTREEVIIAF